MAVLDQLEPKKVFQFFEEMCAIPHDVNSLSGCGSWVSVAFGDIPFRHSPVRRVKMPP